MISDTLTSQSVNFLDDFNFLYPKFLANFIDHPEVQNFILRIIVSV